MLPTGSSQWMRLQALSLMASLGIGDSKGLCVNYIGTNRDTWIQQETCRDIKRYIGIYPGILGFRLKEVPAPPLCSMKNGVTVVFLSIIRLTRRQLRSSLMDPVSCEVAR